MIVTCPTPTCPGREATTPTLPPKAVAGRKQGHARGARGTCRGKVNDGTCVVGSKSLLLRTSQRVTVCSSGRGVVCRLLRALVECRSGDGSQVLGKRSPGPAQASLEGPVPIAVLGLRLLTGGSGQAGVLPSGLCP